MSVIPAEAGIHLMQYPAAGPVHAGQWLSIQDLLDPADDAAFQANLDAVRMQAGLGENIPDDAFGQSARTLILLLDDLYAGPHLDIGAMISRHACFLPPMLRIPKRIFAT
jgi:hypothetical protein